jgi:hypothetical protein
MEPGKTTIQPNPYEPPKADFLGRLRRRYRVATIISFLLPFVVPFVCSAAYEPINREWTVKKFGCGCPGLDGTYHFNANDFNAILWGIILVACLSWWVPAARSFLPDKVRRPGCVFGGFVLICICLKMWARGVWM